ncbi:hypothetical protein MKX03_035814 [Papaver bracteatum]|nr:hypothetical protein MKX03_035814 [Papaver bracteatum]
MEVSSTATYARIIQELDIGDEDSGKSMKEELLKTVEESKSHQNVETKAKKVIDENDGLILDVKDKVDRSKETVCESVEFLGCARSDGGSVPKRSRVNPQVAPLKKKKLEEETGNQNDEAKEGLGVIKPMSGGLTELLEKHAERIADGTTSHQFDYMSPKPWFPERIVNPYGPCVKW